MKRIAAVLLLFTACASAPPSAPHVDHIMLGISDLDAGIRELQTLTGVRAVYGGEHPNRGTHNALVSLGESTYIEIIAPRPGTAVSRDLAVLTKLDHLTPIGWAVSMPNVRELARNGIETTAPEPGSRRKPSGELLRWKIVEIAAPLVDNAPFFIHWADASQHPARTSPGGCTLASLELTDPKAADLTRIVQALGLAFPVQQGEVAAMRVELKCGERRVEFPALHEH